MVREHITWSLDEPDQVSDLEFRRVVQQLLFHLGLDVVRVKVCEGGDVVRHELEKA